MKKIRLIVSLCLPLLAFTKSAYSPPPPEDFCGLRNNAYQAGEQISYTVYYAVAGVFVNAGNATFTNTLERINNTPVYHITGEGKTNPNYDWIYKVRDKYETFIGTATLKPLKFLRNVNAVTTTGVFKVPECVQDVVSSIYYARNIDFDKYKVNDRIPFSMFLDNEVFNMYIRYLGKETVKTKYGKFRAIKFKPLLLKGTIFEGGEKMTVWVSDDENHVPLRVESPIVVGSVKVDMMSNKNMRHPLTSLIKVRGG
jgi:Protein of unknown function (DUF3108)